MSGTFPRLAVSEVRAAFAAGDAEGWSELHRRHGDTLWLPSGILLTIDLELIEAMLMERPHTETRPELYRQAARFIPGADGLLFQTNPLWERHLRAVIPVFHKAHLASVSRAVTKTVARHAEGWAREETVPDFYVGSTRMGVEVALQTLFGIDAETRVGRRIAEILIRYKLATMRNAPHARMDRPDASWKNMLASVVTGVGGLMLSLAREMRALDHALAEVDEALTDGCVPALREVAPSRKALIAWLNHLFGAYNAIDYTLTAALVLLERHPEVRHTLRSELESTADCELAPDLLAALPMLHAFAREVFRVAPVANAVLRETGTPLTAKGVTLPPGTQVALGIHALHHDRRHWQEPSLFDPARWTGSAAPHTPFAYIPFLMGPRRCWGRPLAEMVFVQTMRELLVRYDVRVLNPDVRPTFYFMPRFNAPVRAVVKTRPGSTMKSPAA